MSSFQFRSASSSFTTAFAVIGAFFHRSTLKRWPVGAPELPTAAAAALAKPTHSAQTSVASADNNGGYALNLSPSLYYRREVLSGSVPPAEGQVNE